ncbi:MAG: sugar-binding protein [Kiritimatiellae bacterium]|nr:sugar-binding protein [Kiritimatiellia bacterium]
MRVSEVAWALAVAGFAAVGASIARADETAPAQPLVTASFNGTLDTQGATLSFSRASGATFLEAQSGKFLDVGPNVPRFEALPGRPGTNSVGLLLEGRSKNLLLNSSFEEADPAWRAEQAKTQRTQDAGLHGAWGLSVTGPGRIVVHAPLELTLRAPWNEYYLSAAVRRADGKLLEAGEVTAVAGPAEGGQTPVNNPTSTKLGDAGWHRVGGWFGATGTPGTKFLCGFAFSRSGDYVVDAVQLEPVLRWPRGASSYIPTGTLPADRAGDCLTLPTTNAFPTEGGAITVWFANREDSPPGLLFHTGDSGAVAFSPSTFHFPGVGGRDGGVVKSGWRQVALVWDGQQADFLVNGYSTHSSHGPVPYSFKGDLEPVSYISHPKTMGPHGLVADFTVWNRQLKDWELRHLASTGTVAGAEPPVETEMKVEVKCEIPRAGKVTLGLYGSDGVLKRQLLVGAKLPAGPHTAFWDGRDDDGRPLPVGDYELRGAVSGIRGVFDGKVGNNSPSPGDDGLQYRNGKYIDVEAQPDGGCLTLSTFGEGARTLQKIKADGHVAWSCTRCDPGPGLLYALASDGEWVYVVTTVTNEKDPKTGERLIRESIVRFRLADGTIQDYDFAPTLAVNKPRSILKNETASWYAEEGIPPTGSVGVRSLDAAKGRLYVPLYYEDRVAIFDAEKGTELLSFPVKRPVGIAGAARGVLHVVSEQTVRRFSLDGKDLGVVAAGLEDPFGVDVAANGDVLVTDLGTAQQVKVFDKNGQQKATFGCKGGILTGGRMAPDKLAVPLGISAGRDGAVWVADYGNNRALALDAQWKMQRELVARMFTRVSFNSLDPDLIYELGGHLVEYRVDHANRTWELTRQWPVAITKLGPLTGMSPLLFRQLGGRTFVIMGTVVFEIENDELIPRARLGRGPYRVSAAKGFEQQACTNAWVWRDANRDGRYQKAEYEEGTWPSAFNYHDNWADEAGNLYLIEGATVMTVPFEGLDDQGNPRYHWAQAKTVVTPGEDGPSALSGIITDPAGNIYVSESTGYSGYASLRRVDVRKYSPEGKLQWIAGSKQKGFKKPGMLFMPLDMAGWLDGFLFVGNTEGTIEVFTDDGLWVGRLGDDVPEEYLNIGETFGHCVFRHPKTGKVYAYTSPNLTFRMSRFVVEGLDSVARFRGQVQLKEPAVGIRVEGESGPPPMRVLQRVGPVTIDGDLGGIEWGLLQPTLNAPAPLPEEGDPQATCWAQWDDEALYLAFRILDSTPAVSKQKEDMRWGADQVEFCLCTRQEEHIYHAKWSPYDFQLALGPDVDGRADCWILTSGGPKGMYLPDAKVAVKVQPGQGYVIEARLPWSSLGGYKPAKGTRLGWNFVVDWGTPDGMAWQRSLKWRAGLTYMPENWGVAVLE